MGGGERSDTGVFKCSECETIFRRRDHLGRHMMTQHNLSCQKIKCPFKDCDTEMARRDHLRRHISQVHKVDPSEVLPYSRRKPNISRPSPVDPCQKFKCVMTGCDAELSRKDHLCRHIKNIHKTDPREVLGHLLKQAKNPKEEGEEGTMPTSSSPVKKPRKTKKKTEGGGTVTGTAPVDNQSQSHQQPHPSTLSDYDYG